MSWSSVLAGAQVTRVCTRIEVKPHNRDGIRAGLDQLLNRWKGRTNPNCPAGKKPNLFLITYQPMSAVSDLFRAHILPVDPGVASDFRQGRVTTTDVRFRALGLFKIDKVNESIRRRDCPTWLGGEAELAIRRTYTAAVSSLFKTPFVLPYKHPSATGPDIEHELAEFLHELANTLDGSVAG